MGRLTMLIEVTNVAPKRDRRGNIRTRDWVWAWVVLGGLLILAALLYWLNYGPRAA